MRMTMASCGSSALVPCFFPVAQYREVCWLHGLHLRRQHGCSLGG
uniref:Uncharacterized protein n=1 Tax=Arundo donax TaxID=35708 RepID=A0A0A9AS24_ARUDO